MGTGMGMEMGTEGFGVLNTGRGKGGVKILGMGNKIAQHYCMME
jgi:hypothetical protein